MFRSSIATLLLSFAVVVGACTEDEPPPAITGVNDVVKACGIRAQWTRLSSLECNECVGISTTPLCDCTARKDYAAKCHEHQLKRNKEAACEGVGTCTLNCREDCNCVEQCFAGHEACRPIASALDGCVAEVCDPHCR